MTGHGAAIAHDEHLRVAVEIRAVNNRYLKISVLGELDAELLARIEAIVRQRIQRGTVTVRVAVQFLTAQSQFALNPAQILAYCQQLEKMNPPTSVFGSLLALPGVVTEVVETSKFESVWPTIESALHQALENFVAMRKQEGQAMLNDLLQNCDQLQILADQVKSLSPSVVESYSTRLTERINRLLNDHQISVTTADLVREIGLFAERIDTSEETVRLDSHIKQFRKIAVSTDSTGRKLDFLSQELLREANTIGSKANDAQIASRVVEMKTLIERIREMVQNIE
jgi:uncharacterized protein (TIGR00255 family)